MTDTGNTRILKVLMPVVSVLLFFAVAEGGLRLVGYTPAVTRHGVEIPFWAKHAGTFGRALDQLVVRTRRLTHDVDAYQEDLVLFYRLRSNMNIPVSFYDVSGKPLQGNFPDWILATDANGRRHLPVDREKNRKQDLSPPIDVAVMGGSSMFGWGTDYQNTCTSVFEMLANGTAADTTYRTTNYAVPGYAMSQQLRILQAIIDRHEIPDWIFLDATSNCDLRSRVTDRDREASRLSLPGRLRYYLGKCRFFNLMEILLMKLTPDHDGSQERLPTTRIPMGAYERDLNRFIDLARKNDIRLVLIGMCANRAYVKKMVSIALDQQVPHINFYDLIQAASNHPDTIPFNVGEKEAYRGVYPEKMLETVPSLYMTFPDECHPNPTGHRMLAHALHETVIRGDAFPK